MVFNSWIFGVFFVAFLLLYLRMNHRWQNWLLLISSYVFYGFWDIRFISLLCFSTLLDYFCSHSISKSSSKRTRRALLVLSICCNLGVLGIFKYCDFFAEGFVSLAGMFGFSPGFATLNIVLPVGISFYTFQTMGYTIDVYRGDTKPCRSLRDFAVFVAFFPQLVAGPIERSRNLIQQISSPRILTTEGIKAGFWLIIHGFFLKVVIADNCAIIADRAFESSNPGGAESLLGIYAFALQIYGDFAGYSRIARGISLFMGIRLMENFRQPYFATNPSDFWQRWHISLSSWLRDYLYIPLGGNRSGRWRTQVNLMVTMLLGGLWHGAAFKFVLWGLYQGLLLVTFRGLARTKGNTVAGKRWLLPLKILAYFQLTCFGWLIFRCNSVEQILLFPRAVLTEFSWNTECSSTLYALLFLAAPVFLFDAVREAGWTRFPSWRPVQNRWARLGSFGARNSLEFGLALLLLLLCFSCGVRGGKQFIYFQF